MGGFAWVTLATNDSYSLGALVLAHSLRNVNTAHKLAVLITPGVSPPMKEQLSTVFDVVKVVDVLDSKDEAHLALMKRPELGVTFTKIHCWRLTEFEKCVFLDADTLVLKNCDELFEREELSAAPDVGWPDCFNTGVFVFKPSIETFDNLMKFSLENGSFDGGDQGLLNQFFGDWATKDINKHLPFTYNLTSVAVYSYIPAFKQYETQVRIIHFIGSEKPWLQQLDPETRSVNTKPGTEHLAPMLQIWWNIFCDKVHPSMTSNLECDSGMRNDEIEACVNDTPIQPEPENIQPFVPYVDKDDSRQINLPYQPFDVKSSSGELLNITYLENRHQEMVEEEKLEDVKKMEEEKREVVQEEWNPYEGNQREEAAEKEKEIISDVRESPSQHPIVEEEQPLLEEPPEEKAPVVESSPFSYDTFFPDETCVQTYLEQNVMTYQPLDNREGKQDVVHEPEQEHHLPRFLTLAEDDKRQSLNVCCREEPILSQPSHEDSKHHPSENVNQTMSEVATNEDWHVPEASPEYATPRSRTMSNPGDAPPTNPLEGVSFWKSHPNLSDTKKRYSMPKLKPILPKENVSQVFVSDIRAKITQYTEFHMNCEYPDAVPMDTLGFIERHILEKATQRVPNAHAEKLNTLSYIFPLETEGKTETVSEPRKIDDDIPEQTDYDLSSCQRQRGNQPLQNVTNKRRNSCFLPVLKPIRPSTNEEAKRKIKSSGRSSKEGGTKAKIESRKAREKVKAELSIKPSGEPSSVEDILKKLINFSKDYQGYFNEQSTEKKKEEENLLGAVFKNVYAASTKDSPRIQYSKEFDELTDVPLSPLANGHVSNTNEEDTDIVKPSLTMDVNVEELIQKKTATPLGTIPKTPNSENGCNGTFVFTLSDDASTVHMEDISEERTEVVNGTGMEKIQNGYEANGESSRSETPEPTKSAVGMIETNKMDIPEIDRNGTLSPGERIPTYASVVKSGEKAFRTDPVTSNATQPKKKISAKRSRPSRSGRKEKDQPRIPNHRASRRPPPPPPPRVQETDIVAKLTNPFSVISEDSQGRVTMKSPKRKAKPVPSLSSRRPPARKSNLDRRVVESLATIDDAHVDNSGIAGAIAKLSIQPGGLPGTPSEVASSAQEDYIRRQNWEMGTMDYMGRDSFDNIWSKICKTIDGKAGKDLDQGGASSTPSAEATMSLKEEIAPPEKSQGQPQGSPEKMIAQSDVILPSDASADTGKIAAELTAKASDIASKATEALGAFGKLFTPGSGIKPEVAEDKSKPSEAGEKKEEPNAEEAVSTERRKSAELDEDGKQKKGVINKILELVGVGKPETSTAVFYDTEQAQSEQAKEDRGKSVFYDTETPPVGGAGREESGLSTTADTSKGRASSPSLTLKTAPGTEVVCPTPPSTPMTPLPGFKDDKMLTVDDTIKATPPVTDKKFDDVPKPADKDTIKSEVDNIIDAAKKIAEDQLQEIKAPQTPASSTSMALVPRLNDALEVFGKMFVSGPVTIKSEVPEETPKPDEAIPRPAIPMHDVPGRPAEGTAPMASQVPEGVPPVTEAASATLPQEAGSEKSISPQSTEAAVPASETVTPGTTQVSEPAAVDEPKPLESSPTQIAELAAAAVEAVAAVLAKVADPAPSAETSPAGGEPQVPTQVVEAVDKPVAPEPEKKGTEGTPKVNEMPTLLIQPATPQLETPGTPQPVETADSPAQPETAKQTETTSQAGPPATHQTTEAPAPTSPTPQAEVPPTPIDAPKLPEKPDEDKKAAEDKIESPQSPSILSKAEEALEAFGKRFISGPVTLKSEVPESAAAEKPPESEPVSPAKDPEPSDGHSKASEALEAFGKVFVSGPVTLKSEVPEEAKTPGEAEPDAVHRVFQPKPEEEQIYSNTENLEEIKVMSEDRRKEKPQSSKLTEQILKAIPPELRKPFSDTASDVSAEVAQLLSSAEQQTTSILLDKPVAEEDTPAPEEGDRSGPAAPPIPPRRNRSKGRDAPLPPPKKKGKNGKD